MLTQSFGLMAGTYGIQYNENHVFNENISFQVTTKCTPLISAVDWIRTKRC